MVSPLVRAFFGRLNVNRARETHIQSQTVYDVAIAFMPMRAHLPPSLIALARLPGGPGSAFLFPTFATLCGGIFLPQSIQEVDLPIKLNPYIETFRMQAERMDELGIAHDPDAALVLLAQFMGEIEGGISEEELFALAEIGGHLFREGLRRKMIRRVK